MHGEGRTGAPRLDSSLQAGVPQVRRGRHLFGAAGKDDRISIISIRAHRDQLLGFLFFKPLNRPDVHIETFGCPFALRLDPGHALCEDGRAFVLLTDNELTFAQPGGHTYQDYGQLFAGADMLVHDAEFTAAAYEWTKRWGHSLYADALRLGMEASIAIPGPFHHNQDRADKGVDTIPEDCQRLLAKTDVGMKRIVVAALLRPPTP